jgi:hypothetical protein
VPEPEQKSLPQVVSELWELLKSYAKQETIDPIKGLGRYVGYGVAGSIVLGTGVLLLLLSGLRALQTETDTTFTGNWSWAPYLITLVVGTVLILLAVSRITQKKRKGES